LPCAVRCSSSSVPSPLSVIYDGLGDCRVSGQNGYDPRYLVIAGDEGMLDGRLARHLRSRGFRLQSAESVPGHDDGWERVVGKRGEVLLLAGPLAGYLADPKILTGPNPFDVREAIGSHPGPFALVALEPTGVACEVSG
jgi:hypothetical protein